MKKVIVTGGSGGIGGAVVRRFASAGYDTVLVYNSSHESALSVANGFENVTLFRADLSDREQIKNLVECHSDADVLVNNAGVSVFGLFDAVSEDEASRLYNINLFAPLRLTRGLLPHMLHRKSGVIINVSSIWGETGGSCEVDYSASKAALIGFTKALAKEVGQSGIRVNCVCPGIIDTAMNSRLSVDEVEDIVDSLPLERLGNPSDVADSVFFLASEQASYITGAVLDVNGGM